MRRQSPPDFASGYQDFRGDFLFPGFSKSLITVPGQLMAHFSPFRFSDISSLALSALSYLSAVSGSMKIATGPMIPKCNASIYTERTNYHRREKHQLAAVQ